MTTELVSIRKTDEDDATRLSCVVSNTIIGLEASELPVLFGILSQIPRLERLYTTFDYLKRKNQIKMCVCGFYLDSQNNQVLLIQKARPNWQRGFLNGIGGKIEDFESPVAAMIREFKEETGVHIVEWKPLVTMYNKEHNTVVYFFYQHGPTILAHNPDPEEPLQWVPIDNLSTAKIIYNLLWLIPLAVDKALSSPINEEYIV